MGKVKKSGVSSIQFPKTPSGRTVPKCGRCYRHGVEIQLAGHKRYCRYQNCICPICQLFKDEQKLAAKNILLKRARQLEKEKVLNINEIVPDTLFYPIKKEDGLQNLLMYVQYLLTYEMYKSGITWYNFITIELILSILINFCKPTIMFDLKSLECAKAEIFRVFYGKSMTFQQPVYNDQQQNGSSKEQLVGIQSTHAFQNSEYPQEANMSPENSLQSPSEPSTKPSIDFPTESFDSPTEPYINPIDSPTTESSTTESYYW